MHIIKHHETSNQEVIMFLTWIAQTPTERAHILGFAQNPKHLYDLSPKLAHLLETISLGSKGFQTRVMLGGAWGARQFFCGRNLAERRTHTTGQVVQGPYWPVFWLAESSGQSILFNFPVFVQDVCSVCAILVVLTWKQNCFLDKLRTQYNCRLPNSIASWVGKFEGLPNGRANLVLSQNI